MTHDVVEALKEARGLIAGGWCQHAMALDAHGAETDFMDGGARRFCIDGACMRVGRWRDSIYTPMTNALRTVLNHPFLVDWNDAKDRTQADVLALFDRAIELAEQGAQSAGTQKE